MLLDHIRDHHLLPHYCRIRQLRSGSAAEITAAEATKHCDIIFGKLFSLSDPHQNLVHFVLNLVLPPKSLKEGERKSEGELRCREINSNYKTAKVSCVCVCVCVCVCLYVW